MMCLACSFAILINVSSSFCSPHFFVGVLVDWRQAICQALLYSFCIFALLDPVHDKSYSHCFCDVLLFTFSC